VGEVRVQDVDPAIHEAERSRLSRRVHAFEIPSSGHREGPLRSRDMGPRACCVQDMRFDQTHRIEP